MGFKHYIYNQQKITMPKRKKGRKKKRIHNLTQNILTV